MIGELVHAYVGSGGSVVLVSHDRGIVRELADQALVLDKGQLVAIGAPDEVEYLEAR
ncbi:hypothetical protein [Actinocrispum sp. NPDC049592]|uniref:hypothetical protein n=1 Tax=Actinocrispum sp. NPDC049592 TaxID=3154835 RepID=UPI0034189CA7